MKGKSKTFFMSRRRPQRKKKFGKNKNASRGTEKKKCGNIFLGAKPQGFGLMGKARFFLRMGKR